MGSLRINMAEKRLLKHLKLGGQVDDEVGLGLVSQFALTVSSDESTKPILEQHGIDAQKVGALYATVIDFLMPRPWMKVGLPMLVPTQWFMEPERLERLLMRAGDLADQATWSTFLQEACLLAEHTRDAHDQQYGEPKISITQSGGLTPGSGCVLPILIWVAATASLAIMAHL